MKQDPIIPPDFGDPFANNKPTRKEIDTQYRRSEQKEKRQSDYTIHRSPEALSPAEPRPQLHANITKAGDNTPAHDEYEFMSDLFPYQNVKGWNSKSGREFLADFTKATRGQLAVCMSRLAVESPKEFARLWVEMEKFNTPQQSSQQIEANVTQKTDLYAQLQAMNQGFNPSADDTATPQDVIAEFGDTEDALPEPFSDSTNAEFCADFGQDFSDPAFAEFGESQSTPADLGPDTTI